MTDGDPDAPAERFREEYITLLSDGKLAEARELVRDGYTIKTAAEKAGVPEPLLSESIATDRAREKRLRGLKEQTRRELRELEMKIKHKERRLTLIEEQLDSLEGLTGGGDETELTERNPGEGSLVYRSPTGEKEHPELNWKPYRVCEQCGSKLSSILGPVATLKLWVHRAINHRGPGGSRRPGVRGDDSE